MQLGTTFTIEPVLTEGTPEWITWSDGWTVATADAKRAAQFEHTVLITEQGCEVLTWERETRILWMEFFWKKTNNFDNFWGWIMHMHIQHVWI